MKSKFLIALTAIFVLAFAAAVYAFNKTNETRKTTASCCAKKDNCPLKNKEAWTTAENHSTESCCDKADCCGKSGACPMKAKGENASLENCCNSCCGGSCPMKNKEAETTVIQTSGETIANAETCQHKKAGI